MQIWTTALFLDYFSYFASECDFSYGTYSVSWHRKGGQTEKLVVRAFMHLKNVHIRTWWVAIVVHWLSTIERLFADACGWT